MIENGVDLEVWEKSWDEDEILGRHVEDIARVGTQWYVRVGTKKIEYDG